MACSARNMCEARIRSLDDGPELDLIRRRAAQEVDVQKSLDAPRLDRRDGLVPDDSFVGCSVLG